MSRFTRAIRIEQLDDRLWTVHGAGIAWEIGHEHSGNTVAIPAGTITDLASVPRPFWSFIPPYGLHTNAAILHDVLYSRQDHRGRRWADRQFLEAMWVLNVPPLRARIMWAAVRLFGWHRWQRH